MFATFEVEETYVLSLVVARMKIFHLLNGLATNWGDGSQLQMEGANLVELCMELLSQKWLLHNASFC